MLNLLGYHHIENLYDHLQRGDNLQYIICPNPKIADAVRERILGNNSSIKQVMTIESFKKVLMKSYPFEKDQLSRKSEILSQLALAYRYVIDDPDINIFIRAYQILTEVRSFSLDYSVLETVCAFYDSDLSKAVLILASMINEQKISDEHYFYHEMSLLIREPGRIHHFQNQSLVFVGFTHMAGTQLDFISALGLRNNIFFPMPQSVYEKRKDIDWLSWIQFDQHTIIDQKNSEQQSLEVHYFNRGLLTTSVSQLMKFKNISAVTIGHKELNYQTVLQFMKFSPSFSCEASYFENVHDIIYEQLEHYFVDIQLEKEISFEKYLKQIITNYHKKNQYRHLRVALLYMAQLDNWLQLAQGILNLSLFDLKLFKMLVDLDLPRVRKNSIGAQLNALKLQTLADCEYLKIDESEQIFCLQSKDGDIKNPKDQLPEDVQNYLSSIGPLKNSALDFEFMKARVLDYFERIRPILLVENHTLESLQGWSEILENFNLAQKSYSLPVIEQYNDPLANFIDKSLLYSKAFSATSLQSLIDCPRQFYFKYLKPLRVNAYLSSDFLPQELGVFEHRIIQQWFENQQSDVATLAKNCIDQKQSLFHEVEKYRFYLDELIRFSQNGIDIIKSLLVNFPGSQWHFESEHKLQLAKYSFYGKVDFLAESDDVRMILDFKRSAGSIPSKNEIVNFLKIQLPLYLTLAKFDQELDQKNLICGFICLAEPEKSLIFSSEPLDLNNIKTQNLIFNQSFFHEFKNFILDKISNVSLTGYEADPVKANSCTFCELKYLCPKQKTILNHNAGESHA